MKMNYINQNIKKLLFVTVLLMAFSNLKAQEELYFNNLDSLLVYAEKNSYTIKNANKKTLISKWQKIAAQAAIPNFKFQTNFSLTDNLELPVTYLPAEAFGGQPGTFKEVTTGQQYMSNLNFLFQADLLNLSSWSKLKSARIDTELTQVSNKLAKKSLFESIAATYYNILSLQSQIKTTGQTLVVADTLLANIERKYNQGLVRLQDLNDSKINKLSTKDKLQQLEKSLEQQKNNLKILCDIPTDSQLFITEKESEKKVYKYDLSTDNQLKYKQSLLEAEKAKAEIKRNKFMQLPVLSFVFYDAWLQNNNTGFFDSQFDWNNSKYVGLKLSIPFPNITAHTQTKISKFNAQISEENLMHIQKQNDLENRQLIIDYQKAYSQLETNKQIKELKEENYRLALNQFKADILPTDRLLTAYNDMLVSRLNYDVAYANWLYTISKININNTIK